MRLRNGLLCAPARAPAEGGHTLTGWLRAGLFNNVAVAARAVLEASAAEGLGLRRVLIVDWDVHHGNGTQEVCAAMLRLSALPKSAMSAKP